MAKRAPASGRTGQNRENRRSRNRRTRAARIVAAVLAGFMALSLLLSLLTGCSDGNSETAPYPVVSDPGTGVPDDKYRTYYEVFVYSFADSNGDGIGDLNGLTSQLDYLNDGDPATTDDLGVTGIWLMPIMPSPTYHKYDVMDYMAIDPAYGTLDDFDVFIAAAEARGINVIIDLVLNHTSSEHPWFKSAVEALRTGDMENPYIDYYHFSREKSADFWYEAAPGWYYEGRFWSGMPDLNLGSEAVAGEFNEIIRFWLERGVAGFRLDAVKEFYSGDNPANIDVLRRVNDAVKGIDPDAYIVAEAWDGFAVYANYLDSGIDSVFDFAFADYSGIAVRDINRADGQDYAKNMVNAQEAMLDINQDAIPASFLSNHDTGRLAGFLSGDLDKLKLAAALNMLHPGTSFIYYGEEIGMRGSGNDENKRVALLWDEDAEMLTGNPPNVQEDSYGYPFGSVADQLEDPTSLLSYYRDAVELRNTFPALTRGVTEKYGAVLDKRVMTVTRSWEGGAGDDGDYPAEDLLILVNFSDEQVQVELAEEDRGVYEMAGVLQVGAERPVFDAGVADLPPYGVLILRKSG